VCIRLISFVIFYCLFSRSVAFEPWKKCNYLQQTIWTHLRHLFLVSHTAVDESTGVDVKYDWLARLACIWLCLRCVKVKFQKRAGSVSSADDQRKDAKCNPREQLTNECFSELLSLAKDISQYIDCFSLHNTRPRLPCRHSLIETVFRL